VITDLFVASSAIDADAIARAIPPACLVESSSARVTASNGELMLEFPEWRPRAAARHLLPSFSLLTDVPYAVRFELIVYTGGAWSPWIATATIGPGTFVNRPTAADALACDIDVYRAATAVERLRLRVRIGAPDLGAVASAPWIATLSASDLHPRAPETSAVSIPRLPVPALSQLDAPPEIALRICSPTSVAMVLGYCGASTTAVSLAEDMFHPEADRYGVWPAAIRAAGRRGVAGYLLRFPDWSSAAWCLGHGLPIIASVSYAAGELTGAPLPETSGHLLVLTGCDGGDVFVNDPIAPTAAEVPRSYRLDQIQRVWLDRAGIGYVLFRTDRIKGG
jgi:hypothetical protein